VKCSDFDYGLPAELIAQRPCVPRDAARLMVVHRATGAIEHKLFRDILAYCAPSDALVLNDTRVVPCRLLGTRASGGKVEAFLLRHLGGGVFEALLKPGRLRQAEEISFGDGALKGRLLSPGKIAFEGVDPAHVYRYGVVPLPPYIRRSADSSDEEQYQTVYARVAGAVAAPTAGLHFTPELLCAARTKGVRVCSLTLHVGYGTFKPVKQDDLRAHVMEPEEFDIPDSTAMELAAVRAQQGKVIAVGTTSCRALEAGARGIPRGHTDLFLYPGCTFNAVDALVTNFHLPRTTLFMLVCAFGTTALMQQAYQTAVAQRYRFYSYGDAMLIL
jgi:S-adenosylmethionine:tRNA ribosyltransferase-isomerase